MEISKDTLLDKNLFRSKEVSWLSFNARVLQEAGDPSVPLIDRIRFLGIYSSNLDEFFRVRVATLKRLIRLGKHYRKLQIPDPKKTFKEVNRIAHRQAEIFNGTYHTALAELKENRIRLITEKEVPDTLQEHLLDYFVSEVKPRIMPILVKGSSLLGDLKDYPMYLAVRMSKRGNKTRAGYALLEIPSDKLPRFVTLPDTDGVQLVMYLDDIIRFGLKSIFSTLPYDTFESYAIKFTRDSEMEFDDDVTESIYEKVADGLRERQFGNPVRLNYDAAIPQPMLKLLQKKLKLTEDDTLFPGARYHNRKDLMDFPAVGPLRLRTKPASPIPHPTLKEEKKSLFRRLRTNDILLHFPYHSFSHFLDLLREASMDPLVTQIYFTQYRLAKNSCVANALASAVKNGKKVTVMVEPRARFDEGRNIDYANLFQEAGIKVLLGVPGLKVHAKLCLIARRENGRIRHYSAIGTGNFNEDTADLYTDHLLLTSHQEIGKDIARSFRFFQNSFNPPKLRHLIAAPFNLRKSLHSWIQTEIDNAEAGKPASIKIKINNLSDLESVALLYRAAQAGVKIQIIARSMFSLITGQKGISEEIHACGIVDNYLEHSRIFVFENAGKPRYFISSADFLPRNFDGRFEIVCPIYDLKLQKQLAEYMRLQLTDTVKSRILDKDLLNNYNPGKKRTPDVRAQVAIRKYLQSLTR